MKIYLNMIYLNMIQSFNKQDHHMSLRATVGIHKTENFLFSRPEDWQDLSLGSVAIFSNCNPMFLGLVQEGFAQSCCSME